MNTSIKNIIISSVVALIVISVILSMTGTKQANKLGAAELNRFIVAPTNSSVTCDTTSTLAVASSTGRKYFAIVNDGSTAIYLGLGKAAVLNKGIRLNATGGTFEMNPNVMFSGAIYCISSAATNATLIDANL